MQEIFQVIEFQLFMVILIAVGVTSATIILISYTLFWAMKLTGETILLKSYLTSRHTSHLCFYIISPLDGQCRL